MYSICCEYTYTLFYDIFYGGTSHMKLQQLLSYARKAVDDYAMIDDGDKIAIGISGG